MSFLQYLMHNNKTYYREAREDIKYPCKYIIYKNLPFNSSQMNNAVIINMSSKGFGIIVSPPLEELNNSVIKKDKYKIYIEVKDIEFNSITKIHGEIRWIKSVTDIAKPYSEIGILLKTAEDESKTAIIDAVCKSEKN